MAILAECPICHRKQATRNKKCSCGEDLVKAKRSQRVRYWITFRLPGGKQRKEAVGFSIEEARDADGKRRGQKREGRIFDMLPESKMTFSELAEWYLELPKVKRLATYGRVESYLDLFNRTYGDRKLASIRPVDLESFQEMRAEAGVAPATIDLELTTVKTMVTRAFDNDMVDGRVLKAFRTVKNKLKMGANARERTLTIGEYQALLENAPRHLQAVLVMAFHTGLRRGEILGLKWSHIDREKGSIRLPAEMTKERRAKIVPVNRYVKAMLDSLPRALHHEHVFTYAGRPMSAWFGSSLPTACKEAGITYGMRKPGGFRFHDLRATFKTNLLRAGVDKAIRDTLVGHTLKGMDAFYLKPTEEDLRAAIDRFTAWYDAQTEGVAQAVAQGPIL
jgi:integrase